MCDHEESESSNDSTSEEERNASSEPPTLVAPTTTIVDPPCPELLDANVISGSSLITPYTKFTELREPLELIDRDNP